MTFLPTGVWYEGGVGSFRDGLIPDDVGAARALFARNFSDLAAQGVNAVVVPNLAPTHHIALLDAAQANRKRCIIELDREGGETGAMIRGSIPYSETVLNAAFDRKLKPILGHPALWKIQLIDEPPPESFGRYQKVAEAAYQYVGSSKGFGTFSCLTGADGFANFLSTTGSNIAAFDFYPLVPKAPVGDSGALGVWEAQCLKAAAACRAAKADAWAVIQAHEIPGGLRFPTPEELRCMTWLALASGCNGVWWFLYQTEWINKANGTAMRGLVDENYRGGANWAEVGRLTRAIAGLAPLLATLIPIPAHPAWDAAANPPATLWRDDSRRGSLYVFAVNRDTRKSQPFDMHLRPGGSGKVIVRRLPGQYALPTARRNRDLVTATEQLLPGEGALYRIDGAAA